MSNFAGIAWLDPFDLSASLRTRMGLFKPTDSGLPIAFVRSHRPGNPEAFGYTKASGVASGKWPELKIVLDRLTSASAQMNAELGRVQLEMLPAGGCSPWERSESPFDHGRLLLRGNPGLVFYGGAETWLPTIGVLTLINRRVPNSAVNMGESPAIWLAVDFRRIATGEPQEEKL